MPNHVLILGYSLNNRAKLFVAPPASLLHHTLIVGQSGSGKSFLVARLLEEILAHTSARIVVLDPNGDFRDFGVPANEVWTKASTSKELDHVRTLAIDGGFPTVDSAEEFRQKWSTTLLAHLSTDRDERRQSTHTNYFGPLRLDWQNLQEEQDVLLAVDASFHAKTLLGLKACRENLEWVLSGRPLQAPPPNLRGLIDIANRFANQNINLERYEYVKSLTREHWEAVQATLLDLLRKHAALWYAPQTQGTLRPTPDLCEFIDLPFTATGENGGHPWQGLLLGLDAADPPDARLVAEVALWRLWKRVKGARSVALRETDQQVSRKPTFVVVDEAHTFAPADPPDALTKRVTERLVQIASEGRKYGLYLILSTQRPTKLHPALVAECENQFVLRLQASMEHEFTAKVLGIPLDRARNVERFATGQALVSGRCIEGGGVDDIVVAPARTTVGGGEVPSGWEEPLSAAVTRMRVPGEVPSVIAQGGVAERLQVVTLELLSGSSTKVPLVRLAADIDRRVNHQGSGTNWASAGGFKEFLRTVPNVRVQIDGTEAWAYLEGIHNPNEAPAQSPLAQSLLIDQVAAETGTPRLTTAQYGAVFQWIAEATDGVPFSLAEVGKTIRDRAVAAGYPVSRQDANFVVRSFIFRGHVFAPDVKQSAADLAAMYAENVKVLARRAGIPLSVEDETEIDAWIRGLSAEGSSAEAAASE